MRDRDDEVFVIRGESGWTIDRLILVALWAMFLVCVSVPVHKYRPDLKFSTFLEKVTAGDEPTRQ